MNHQHPAIDNWGIMPVLFKWGTISVSSYSFFVALGIVVGAVVYYFEARKERQLNEHSFLIAIGALTGAAVGAKLLEIIINIDHIESFNELANFLYSGRTIIGGLIGGTLGSMVTKRIMHIQTKKGNLFAPAIALGLAVGRLGCFFNGCCYGKPSNLPWAVNFGDGVLRHPTQLYESLFMLLMFIALRTYFKKDAVKPGHLFKVLMISYFLFRFLVEFIRVERTAFWYLSYFQVIAIFVLLYLCWTELKLLTIKLTEHGRKFR